MMLRLRSQLGTPDIVSFSAAISACGAGRSWRHALALLRGANARLRGRAFGVAGVAKFLHLVALIHLRLANLK